MHKSQHGAATHDPTYRAAWEVLRSAEAIERAGYFDDGLKPDTLPDLRWCTFPCNKIAKRFRSTAAAQDMERELVVLFTTGACCPIHVGHLELMEAAK
jgi:hypothetical protein